MKINHKGKPTQFQSCAAVAGAVAKIAVPSGNNKEILVKENPTTKTKENVVNGNRIQVDDGDQPISSLI